MLSLRTLSFLSSPFDSLAGTKRWSRSLGETAPERIAAVLTVGFVALGLVLRARGYLFGASAFWLDECSWAMRIIERPLVQSLIRPIGFLAVSKFLALTVANTETVLRALPWAAGVVTTLAAPLLARRLYRAPAARVLFVAIIALSPFAIDFSKEFKPYSLSLALHLGLALLALRYVESKRGRDLTYVLGLAALGSLFAQDLVLAFPGVFLLLGLGALDRGRSHVLACVGVACAIVAGLGLQYFLMWKHLPADHTEFWGAKYNVFHTARDRHGFFVWSLDRLQDMAAMPGFRRTQWSADWLTSTARQRLRLVDEIVWTCAFGVGLVTLAWRRRFSAALLVVLPLVVLWAFNAAGFWPLGAFRTNVFTVVYSGAIVAFGFDVSPSRRSLLGEFAPVLVLVVLPLALFERSWHERKRVFTYDSTFPRALELLAAMPPAAAAAPPELVVLDRRSCDPWRYYTTYHPRVSARVSAAIAQKYVVKCAVKDTDLPHELLAGTAPGRRRWTVLHVTRPFDKMMRSGRFGNLRVVKREDVGSHTVVALSPAPGPQQAAAETEALELEAHDDD
jgi:hypothetical protein